MCSPTERAKSVGEEPKRRRWRMKRGDEVAAVGISAARRRNPGHRKSRLDVRRISAARAAFRDIQQILYTQKVSLQESFSRLRGCCKFFSYMLYSMQSKAVLNFLMEIYYE